MSGRHRHGLTPARRRALNRLLSQYLEQPAQARAGFLVRCRQRWPRLGHWLERLVSSEGNSTLTLLNESLGNLAAGAASRIAESAGNRPAPGHRLGPWRLIEPVSEGGMGLVYQAERDDGAFEKTVAVKLLRLRGTGLGELIQRECQLLARLDHPGICRLLDAGLDEASGPFLVMEWIEGQDLSGWMKSCPSRQRCLEVMMSLCEAVDHAHRQLIVHGDIKPGNVRIDSDGQVKLLDFGIARLAGATEDNPQAIAALTPRFAPPEQHRGEPLDARSDVWALGALLAWLLDGGQPESRPEQADWLSQTKATISDTELCAVIDKACADDPRQRYASASDLLGDLQRYCQHQPLTAMPASAGYRLRKFVRRNPVLVGGIMATTSALVAGLITTSIWYLEADDKARSLEQVVGFQEQQLAGIEPALMGSVLRDLLREESQRQLALLDSSYTTDGTPARDFEEFLSAINFSNIAVEALDETIFSASLAVIDEEFRGQPAIRAHLTQTVATALRELGRIDSAATQQARVLKLRREHLGAEHPDTLHSMHEHALTKEAQGDFEAAEKALKRALKARGETLGYRHPDTLKSMHELARINMASERHDTALDYGYRALEIQREVLGENNPDTLRTLRVIGVTYRWLGRFDEAIETLEESLQGMRRQLGERHPETLHVLESLGLALARKGQKQEAKVQFRLALENRRSILGDRHPATVRTVCSKGVLLQNMGLIDKAEPLYLECAVGRESLLGAAHADTLSAYNNMGVLLRLREEFGESVAFLEKAMEGQLLVYGNHHRAPLITKHNLGRTLEEKGRYERALKVQTRAVGGFKQILPEDHWLLGAVLYGKGRIFHRMDQFSEAESLFFKTWDIFANGLGPRHHRTTELIDYMGDFYSDWAVRAPEDGADEARARWLAQLDSITSEETD